MTTKKKKTLSTKVARRTFPRDSDFVLSPVFFSSVYLPLGASCRDAGDSPVFLRSFARRRSSGLGQRVFSLRARTCASAVVQSLQEKGGNEANRYKLLSVPSMSADLRAQSGVCTYTPLMASSWFSVISPGSKDKLFPRASGNGIPVCKLGSGGFMRDYYGFLQLHCV